MDFLTSLNVPLLLLPSLLCFLPSPYREYLDALKLGSLAVWLSHGLKVSIGREIFALHVIA
jgi:hypothetical protein